MEDIINGMIYLENHNLHYPLIRKRYTVFVNNTNNFKLLNPYCFSSFLMDCSEVYCHPEKSPF